MEMMTFSVLVGLGLLAVVILFVGAMLAVRIFGERAIDHAEHPERDPGADPPRRSRP